MIIPQIIFLLMCQIAPNCLTGCINLNDCWRLELWQFVDWHKATQSTKWQMTFIYWRVRQMSVYLFISLACSSIIYEDPVFCLFANIFNVNMLMNRFWLIIYFCLMCLHESRYNIYLFSFAKTTKSMKF